MRRNALKIVLGFFLSMTTGSIDLEAARKKTVEERVEKILQSYRRGEYSKKKTWVYLNSLSKKRNIQSKTRSRIKAAQAQLLYNDNYPILASMYSSESIYLSRNPLARDNTTAWKILRRSSKKQPIEFIMDKLALKYMSLNKSPKFFNKDWNYVVASALVNKGKNTLAKEYFSKLKMNDRYYLPSQYQIAMINIEKGLFEDAEARLKTILNDVPQEVSPLKEGDIKNLVHYTHMALARMYYEQGKFILSAYHYRRIPKDSPQFYESLFEQSWAFFMAGKPRYALGSLYGAHTPYFKDQYNPESKILESIVYFWMCRYDEARNSLADFATQHSEAVGGLKSFLERQRLTPETTYILFENLISGVSASSLGISTDVLKTAAERDAMKLIRDQYASVLEELDSLEQRGVFRSKKGSKVLKSRLEELALNLQKELGTIFLTELRSMNEHFEGLYTQAQFLYLELLMGQKEHLLGRELHADNKAQRTGKIKKIRDWGKTTQSWKDEKYEYWWDEVGYQIVDVQPLCN